MLTRGEIKDRAIEFVDSIERLSVYSADKEKEYLENEVKEARCLIGYGEWFIAFENITTNLCEINYKMDHNLIEFAKEIYQFADSSQSEETLWWLNDLKK